MTDTVAQPGELKNPGYEIFIGALSTLSIINLVLRYVVVDERLDQILLVMNLIMSLIFLMDFVFRLITARSRSDYLLRQYGWADLLASLPIEQLKILRLFRLLRVYRLMREFGPRNIARTLVRDRAGSALLTLLLLGILVLEFGSLAILYTEQDADGSNITTAGDALWYILVTISTVGYGDRFPVSVSGRVIGTLVIIVGVGIFGTFTGYLANLFLAPRKATAPEGAPIDQQAKMDRITELMAELQAAIADIEGTRR